MHFLKIVSPGWQGYNGQLNIITFKDGVSTELVPPRIADRIAASVRVVQCDAEGNEGEAPIDVGVQHRLISETASRAPIATALETQTEADKNMEAKLDAARTLTAPVETLYTRVDLEKIADQNGIKGLRDIGDKWDVKGKGIRELMDKILHAQSVFLQLRAQKMEQAGGSILQATTQAEESDLGEAAPAEPEEEVLLVAGFEGLAAEYRVGDVIVPGATLAESALKNSGKSLTGWNAAQDDERKRLVEQEIAALELHYRAKLEPVSQITDTALIADAIVTDARIESLSAAKIPAGSIFPGTLVISGSKIDVGSIVAHEMKLADVLTGSNVLASTYDIAGETVQLGDIVQAAFATFGGTVAEWNALDDENREALLRLELDKRLDAE